MGPGRSRSMVFAHQPFLSPCACVSNGTITQEPLLYLKSSGPKVALNSGAKPQRQQRLFHLPLISPTSADHVRLHLFLCRPRQFLCRSQSIYCFKAVKRQLKQPICLSTVLRRPRCFWTDTCSKLERPCLAPASQRRHVKSGETPAWAFQVLIRN